MNILNYLLLYYLLVSPATEPSTSILLEGAWKSDKGVVIMSDDYFSYAAFDAESRTFNGTYGGIWSMNGDQLVQRIEYNTFNETFTGKEVTKTFNLNDELLIIDNEKFIRIDNGSPGKLNGAWLFAGRKQDGDLTTRDTSQPRKTMKILSGMRFQWIAYNTETGEFSGTGGGTYSTIGNRYTENIEFFSRDSSRVGASLSFEFEIIDGIWHHQGLNSRGEPMYEVWSRRE
ncbi:MAG: membrane or secreted protein [Cyclobacteriaceae bacterium]|nr:membrane or secreted protein [Cyclobacteriaceae bacterium]